LRGHRDFVFATRNRGLQLRHLVPTVRQGARPQEFRGIADRPAARTHDRTVTVRGRKTEVGMMGQLLASYRWRSSAHLSLRARQPWPVLPARALYRCQILIRIAPSDMLTSKSYNRLLHNWGSRSRTFRPLSLRNPRPIKSMGYTGSRHASDIFCDSS
jgi:hypothetical protein